MKLDIKFPTYNFISVHSHNEKNFLTKENQELLENNNCIYMSDAGMPCVSDPGSYLVDFCLENNIEFDVLPGANAILTAYASSGFSQTTFTFFGFLPHKGNDRKDKLDKVLNSEHLAILYESPHRLLKLLEELKTKVPNRDIFIAKELTKKYQTRYKDSALNIYEQLSKTEIKGEWVVVIENKVNDIGPVVTGNVFDFVDVIADVNKSVVSIIVSKNMDLYFEDPDLLFMP